MINNNYQIEKYNAILHNYLPKDLVNIIEEYSKDRTQYNKVILELNDHIFDYECNVNIFGSSHSSFVRRMCRFISLNRYRKLKKQGRVYKKF